jgi:hypothetical protein
MLDQAVFSRRQKDELIDQQIDDNKGKTQESFVTDLVTALTDRYRDDFAGHDVKVFSDCLYGNV